MPEPKLGFVLNGDTKIGRVAIETAMLCHNELISNVKPVTKCHIDRDVEQFRKWLAKDEKWRPRHDVAFKREIEDRGLKERMAKIKNATRGSGTTDCSPPKKALEYKKWRSQHPGFLPGAAEALFIKAQHDIHTNTIKAAKACVKVEHEEGTLRYKERRARQTVMPPINNPTPAQYKSMKDAGLTGKHFGSTTQSLRTLKSVGSESQSPNKSPNKSPHRCESQLASWPAPAEDRFLMPDREGKYIPPNEGLVKYVTSGLELIWS